MYTRDTKIGVLGSGVVGQVLASAFLKEGNEVMLGSRNLSKESLLEWKKKNKDARLGSYADTAAFGELLILATQGSVAEEVVRQAGLENFSNKPVIDTTNPISSEPPVNGVIKFFTDLNQSLMERIQMLIPDAHLVKAFNSVGNNLMYKPDLNGGIPSMFICGNNVAAKQTVTHVLEIFGWEVEDMGKIEAARAIEPLCILWCIPGFVHNQWTHAFKLLRAENVY